MIGLYRVPLLSDNGIDYRNLRNLLKNHAWDEANGETKNLMLQATYREYAGWLDYHSLRKFPSQDLLTIDALWVKASCGRFGFSVQQQIWAKCGSPIAIGDSDWRRFCLRVGWFDRERNEHKHGHDLRMNLWTSPRGEIPVFSDSRDRDDVRSADYFGFSFLAQRLVECRT
jgi:hypothetical protein